MVWNKENILDEFFDYDENEKAFLGWATFANVSLLDHVFA